MNGEKTKVVICDSNPDESFSVDSHIKEIILVSGTVQFRWFNIRELDFIRVKYDPTAQFQDGKLNWHKYRV